MSAHQKKTPPEWKTAAPKDPGARDLTDPTWVHRYTEFIASLPQVDYSSGSGEGHNNG